MIILTFYLTIYIIIAGVVSFLLYAFDKLKALNNQWRISERTLLNSTILGGFLGSALGMYGLRHKTMKPRFKKVLIGSTIFWVLVIFISVFL